jgi:hypothetical protein
VIDVPYRDVTIDGIERVFVRVPEQGVGASRFREWLQVIQGRYAPEAS